MALRQEEYRKQADQPGGPLLAECLEVDVLGRGDFGDFLHRYQDDVPHDDAGRRSRRLARLAEKIGVRRKTGIFRQRHRINLVFCLAGQKGDNLRLLVQHVERLVLKDGVDFQEEPQWKLVVTLYHISNLLI